MRNSLDNDEEDRQVRTLISFSKGFAYSCGTGLVHMFEKDSPYKYRKRNVFRIDDPDFRESEIELNQVRHLSINVTEDKLLATTNREQLYSVRLWGPDLYVVRFVILRKSYFEEINFWFCFQGTGNFF